MRAQKPMVMAEPKFTVSEPVSPPAPRVFLSPRFMDFWLLGGASILVWACVMVGEIFRNDYRVVDQRFQAVAATFGLLSLVCNHPHFMASYRLAYGQRKEFMAKNWFVLFGLPLFLVAFYAFGFSHAQDSVSDSKWIKPFNWIFENLGIAFRFGYARNLGSEFLGVSVWLMYLTVGWHYAKQAFGCSMAYAHYDSYPLNKFQRRIIKFCVFTVAFYSFCHVSFHWREYGAYSSSYQFLGLNVTEIGLPSFLELTSKVAVVLGIALAGFFIFYKNYRIQNRLPSANFLIPLVAFYIWWIPVTNQVEFYFMMVPFFHSIQYLQFAFRREKSILAGRNNPEVRFTARLLILLLAGFLAFEAVPASLDNNFSGEFGSIPMFFTVAFVVFINVHHFFLDSVLWRSQDREFRDSILSANDPRRI